MDMEDKAKDILDKLQKDDVEEFVPVCMEYLGIKVVAGKLVVPADSPAMSMPKTSLAQIYVNLAIFFHMYGQAELAYCLYLEACRMLKSLPVVWKSYSYSLFLLHYLFISKEENFLRHKAYNGLFKDVWQFSHNKELHRKHKKIRLGYLSSDFRKHVVLLFSWVMLTKYNKERFELYCFSTNEEDGNCTEEIKKYVDVWISLRDMIAPEAAKEIYTREIDILFELGGHATNNLPILAYKPAPVQICGIGYFATTGLKTVDYFLTDKYLMQNGGDRYFVEKMIVMTQTHFCFSPINNMPQVVKGAPCKKNGYITFGSMNDPLKINDVVLETWSAILSKVPGSRLLLKGRSLGKKYGVDTMLRRLQKAGISEDRVELQKFTVPYLPVYWDIDIMLDTFPYPGGGTTCDALYMGVPVITLGDGSHGGDFGISLLKNLKLEECCTYTREEYIERAVLLASDTDLLDILHRSIRNMFENSPLRDEAAYMQELERKYEEIWEKYLRD